LTSRAGVALAGLVLSLAGCGGAAAPPQVAPGETGDGVVRFTLE